MFVFSSNIQNDRFCLFTGTDSRVGFGFRLGEHADFQVLYEIGPQINTRKIGETSSDRRRNIQPASKVNFFLKITNRVTNNDLFLQTKGTAWLQRWAQEEIERQNPSKKTKKPTKTPPPKMPMDVVNHLAQLYGTQKPATDLGTIPGENQPIYTEINTTGRKTPDEVKQITADLADIEFED